VQRSKYGVALVLALALLMVAVPRLPVALETDADSVFALSWLVFALAACRAAAAAFRSGDGTTKAIVFLRELAPLCLFRSDKRGGSAGIVSSFLDLLYQRSKKVGRENPSYFVFGLCKYNVYN
jgi:hypothetical protein